MTQLLEAKLRPARQTTVRLLLPVVLSMLAVGQSQAYPALDELTAVYGDLQQAGAWVEVCTEAFPSTQAANVQAFSAWQERHGSFVRQVNAFWAGFLEDQAGGDPTRKADQIEFWRSQYESTKREFTERLRTDGPDSFSRRCENLPRYFESPGMDLPRRHAEKMERIRVALDRGNRVPVAPSPVNGQVLPGGWTNSELAARNKSAHGLQQLFDGDWRRCKEGAAMSALKVINMDKCLPKGAGDPDFCAVTEARFTAKYKELLLACMNEHDWHQSMMRK